MLLTKSEIAQRYGLTERQVRHRLTALDGLLTGHVSLGQGGQRVLDDFAVAIFDRLMQLEREGLSPSAAVSRIREEVPADANGSGGAPERQEGVRAGQPLSEAVIEELRARLADKDKQIEDLRSERDRLLSIIEQQGEQVRALMPGPAAADGPEGRGECLTRWQALKYLLLGR
jgi:predicted transcriptional regulator